MSAPLTQKSNKIHGGGGGLASTSQTTKEKSVEPTTTTTTTTAAEELLRRLSEIGHTDPFGVLKRFGFERVEQELDVLDDSLRLGEAIRNPAGLLMYRLKARNPRAYGYYLPDWLADLKNRRKAERS